MFTDHNEMSFFKPLKLFENNKGLTQNAHRQGAVRGNGGQGPAVVGLVEVGVEGAVVVVALEHHGGVYHVPARCHSNYEIIQIMKHPSAYENTAQHMGTV